MPANDTLLCPGLAEPPQARAEVGTAGKIATSRRKRASSVGVLEDDESTRWLLSCYMIAGNMRVVGLTDGAHAIHAVQAGYIDVMLVDLGLRDEDGVDIIRSIRDFSKIPLLVVSSSRSAVDVERALSAGADDYIFKPVKIEDLILRVSKRLSKKHVLDIGEVLQEDALKIPPGASGNLRRIVGPQGSVELTPVEAEILEILVKAEGTVVPRDRIVKECLGARANVESRTIDVHMCRLRQKLHGLGIPARLGAVRNKGYFFTRSFDLVWAGR